MKILKNEIQKKKVLHPPLSKRYLYKLLDSNIVEPVLQYTQIFIYKSHMYLKYFAIIFPFSVLLKDNLN